MLPERIKKHSVTIFLKCQWGFIMKNMSFYGKNLQNSHIIKIKNYMIENKYTCNYGCFILFCVFPVYSCARKPDFCDSIICREVDPVIFSPLDVMNNFNIGVQKIFAAIEVSEIRAEDI
jgi:hypothetical protein